MVITKAVFLQSELQNYMNSNILNLNIYPRNIAIIGGGFSGSLVAINLLRNATLPLTIKLIERNSELGRGVAYSTEVDCHLLNVPAAKMSAFPNEPNHFLNWLHQNGYQEVTASTFVSRKIYGDYLQALLQEAKKNAATNVQLQVIRDEAIAIETIANNIIVYLKNSQPFSVQKAVLAVGNFPASIPEEIARINNCNYYVRDGWSADAIANLNPEDSILLVGTGLTMVDVVISLHQQGFKGQIHAVSRHGLMPLSHQQTQPYPLFIDTETAPKTARKLLNLVRREVRFAKSQGKDWRGVIDAIRPITQQLWQALPFNEQKRFLRHIKAYWEIHRHRIAPEIADVLNTTINSGQLHYYAGRIRDCQELKNNLAVRIRERGTQKDQVLFVQRIINCTGSNCNYQQLQHPLLTSLVKQGLIRLHPLSIGIDTADNGGLINTNDKVSQHIYTLGTPRKGNLWETTAVPEIRVQAANLAIQLLKSLNLSQYPALVGYWLTGNPSIAFQAPAMLFRQFFDRESSTYTYLIADITTKTAILVDPVLEQVERDFQVLQELELRLQYCLETHIHADHITSTDKLRKLTACLAILPENSGATCADYYLADLEVLQLGNIEIRAIATPGHTNSHHAYLVNGTHLLTGDALFIRGCGRTDFQDGNAGLLYDTVTEKLFTLPDETLVYPAHDYQGWTVSTIGEEKRWNPRFAGRTRSEFIELMNKLNLPNPQKMCEVVPANQRCGKI